MILINIKEVSYNYLDHLYMKMMLSTDNIKEKIEIFKDEISDTKNILSKLVTYINLNDLTQNNINNAYILLGLINDLCSNKKDFNEVINRIKILLNSSNTINEDRFLLDEYIVHYCDNKKDLSLKEVYSVLGDKDFKSIIKSQIEFDYFFFSLYIKNVFYKSNSIFNLIDHEDMANTNVVVNSLTFYLNEIPILFYQEDFKNTGINVLNLYKELIKKSNMSIFDKLILKKSAKKCLSKLN